MTHNVSSFLELVTSFTSLNSGDVIEILTDLDFNDIVSDPDYTPPFNIGSETQADTITNIKINGNNHVIHNCYMDTRQPSIFFNIRYVDGMEINNLSFDNVWIQGRYGNALWRSFNGNNIVFNGGYIQGRSSDYLIYGAGITVNNMMITISGRGAFGSHNSTSSQPTWNRCWIHLNNVTYAQSNATTTFWTQFYQCYFEGNLSVEGNYSDQRIFGQGDNSVINIETNVDSSTADTFCLADDYAVTSPNVINITKVRGIDDTTSTSKNKCVTDAQLKDAEYLDSIGFNIIS